MKTKVNIDYNLIFSLILGSPIIIFVIWNRFLRIRWPRDIEPAYLSFIYFIILFLFFIYTGLFLYYFKKFLNIPEYKNSFLSKINSILEENKQVKFYYENVLFVVQMHIINGPHRIYDRIYKNFRILRNFFDIITDFITDKYISILWIRPTETYSPFVIKIYSIFMVVIPRYIPCIVFFVEVIFYQRLDYFYKSLIFLIIPLFFNILMFIMKHSIEMRLDYISNFFSIDHHIFSRDGKDFTINLRKIDDISDKEYQTFSSYYSTEDMISKTWINLQNKFNIISQIEICLDNIKNWYKTLLYGTYSITFFIYFSILQGKFLNLKQISFEILFIYIIFFFFSLFIHKIYFYIHKYIYVKPFIEYISKNLSLYIEKKWAINGLRIFFLFPPLLLLFISYIFHIDFLFYVFIFSFLPYLFLFLLLSICEEYSQRSLDFYSRFFIITLNEKKNKIDLFFKKLIIDEDIEDFKFYQLEKNIVNVLNHWEFYNLCLDNIRKLKDSFNLFIFLFFNIIILFIYIIIC